MIYFDKQKIIEYKKNINDSDWWYDKTLFESCFSSYDYYEDLLEKICSIFRGLDKNHAFSNGNKRTASMVLSSLLKENGYGITDEDLIDITLDVAEHNYEVTEIAQKLSKLIYQE